MSTWGEPKKTRGFFLEEEEAADTDADADADADAGALKQKKRRSISEEFIPSFPLQWLLHWGFNLCASVAAHRLSKFHHGKDTVSIILKEGNLF